MQPYEDSHLEKVVRLHAGRVGFEAVIPNPKFKRLDQITALLH